METVPLSVWMVVGLTVLIQLAGVAVNWGMNQQAMQFMREEIVKLWEAHRGNNSRLNDHDSRLNRTEAVCEERHGAHHMPARPARAKN